MRCEADRHSDIRRPFKAPLAKKCEQGAENFRRSPKRGIGPMAGEGLDTGSHFAETHGQYPFAARSRGGDVGKAAGKVDSKASAAVADHRPFMATMTASCIPAMPGVPCQPGMVASRTTGLPHRLRQHRAGARLHAPDLSNPVGPDAAGGLDGEWQWQWMVGRPRRRLPYRSRRTGCLARNAAVFPSAAAGSLNGSRIGHGLGKQSSAIAQARSRVKSQRFRPKLAELRDNLLHSFDPSQA